MGGYSSGPVLLLAALRRVPTLLMEQNTAPGFTNRVLARWVGAAAVSYEETLRHFPRVGVVTGNPVRREFLDRGGRDEPPPADGRTRVLIVGGSQGARADERRDAGGRAGAGAGTPRRWPSPTRPGSAIWRASAPATRRRAVQPPSSPSSTTCTRG